jgi:uncharacterized protein YkwD
LKTACFIILCIFLLTGCGQPEKKKVVIKKNQFYQCEDSGRIEKKMVNLINTARLSGRRCGGKKYTATRPVHWNPALENAARMHSKDMARNDRLSHKGSKKSTVEKRVRNHGYTWRSVGENVAGGLQTCEETVSGWLESPGHCANIMESSFTEIGAACARNSASKYGTYWTLVLASPLK